MKTTLITNLAWIVAWDQAARSHVYLRNADLAFTGDTITHVGPGYAGAADQVIDGSARLAIPGFVNIHAHPAEEPLGKGFMEELGSRKLHMTALYEFMVLDPDQAGIRAAQTAAYAEMLRSGCTTLVDLHVPDPDWVETIAASGLRAWLTPMYRSARWRMVRDSEMRYEWDEAAGERALDAAVEIVERARRHPCGRLDGMLSPAQVDTCTEALLIRSGRIAAERGMMLHIHAAQTVVEFQEMTRRHGKTPLRFLHDLGLLGRQTIIGHAIYTDQHPWIRWPEKGDVALLRESGAGVAHCPNNFARRGMMLHDLGSYLRAGIPVGIGTDTFPHNILDEMRIAILMGKMATGDVVGVRADEVFTAATSGAADMLKRPDLGRLAVGAKADLVLVDITHPLMRPVRDPVKSLLYSAGDRPVRDVFVDGRQVVAGGEVLTLDVAAALDALEPAQSRAFDKLPMTDHAGRSALQMAPLSFPVGSEAP